MNEDENVPIASNVTQEYVEKYDDRPEDEDEAYIDGVTGNVVRRGYGQRAQDRIDITRMYAEGKSIGEIAHWLNTNRDYILSVSQIRHDIVTVRRNLEAIAAEPIAKRRAVELGKIDRLEEEAWNAWFASTKEQITRDTRAEFRGDDTNNPEKIRRLVRTEQSVGDVKYMQMIAWCIDRRVKLLGIDAPTRIDANISMRQMAIEIAEAEGMDVSELMREAQRTYEQTRGLLP